MLNLKKTAVAVLAFGSSAVFAGTMGPVCAPGNVTVPCAHTAWDFGVQALYLEPSYSGFEYVGANTTTAGATTYNTINNPWAWGFKLEGSYHFNTGNDVNLNWYHLDRTNNTLTALPDGSSYTNNSGIAFGAGSSVSASGKSQWDAVNLEFGQHVDFGEFTNIRFHGGLEYARINTTVNLNGSSAEHLARNGTTVLIAAGTPVAYSNNMNYNGVGPRLGSDMSYDWNNGLGVYANGAMAMLVGTNKFTRNNTPGIGAAAPLSFSTAGSTTTVNPELEAKLGATYTYAMAQGDLTLDIGWMWVNYFGVQTSATAMQGVVAKSDFGVQGPFVGLKWLGNVA